MELHFPPKYLFLKSAEIIVNEKPLRIQKFWNSFQIFTIGTLKHKALLLFADDLSRV